MGILSWIVFGLVVGIIAKLVTPGRDPGGFIVTMLLGIAGALLGGFIGRAMGFYGPSEVSGLADVDRRRDPAAGAVPPGGSSPDRRLAPAQATANAAAGPPPRAQSGSGRPP